MSDNNGPNSIGLEELVDAYIRYLEGGGSRPDTTGIKSEAAVEASEFFRLLDAIWASDIDLPPIELDPVALALGFVPSAMPEATWRVAGPKLNAVRRRSRLRPSDVAIKLTEAGYPYSARSLVRLEDTLVQEVNGAFLSALTQALNCHAVELTQDDDADSSGLASWLYSEQFDQQVAKWTAETKYVGPDLQFAARARLLSARHRGGGESTQKEWTSLLRAVLDSLR